jgi:DNA-binding response OmpR family regulator
VVDDEPSLVRLVRAYLERDGFEVTEAHDGESAIELVAAIEPDVIILDLMLPGIDGIEVCRRIRGVSDAYVLMLTARADDADAIAGLATGADDYVTKPFSPGQLLARVRALLRRPRTQRAAQRLGDLVIDRDAREVRRGEERIALTRREFDLLEALAAQPGRVHSRREILERVWGPTWFGDDHVIDVHVANIRRKLEDEADAPRYLHTVRGVGYRADAG